MPQVTCRARVPGEQRCPLPVGHSGRHRPGDDPGRLQLRDVRRLPPLAPGDALVLETADMWTPQEAEEARLYLSRIFPDILVLVVPGGRLAVLPEGVPADAAAGG